MYSSCYLLMVLVVFGASEMLTGVSGYLSKTHFHIRILRNQCDCSERLLSLRQTRFWPKWQIEMPYRSSKKFASGEKGASS